MLNSRPLSAQILSGTALRKHPRLCWLLVPSNTVSGKHPTCNKFSICCTPWRLHKPTFCLSCQCRWPYYDLCRQQVLLVPNFAYDDRFGWTLPTNLTRSAALTDMQRQEAAPTSNDPNKLPADLIQ